jgi:hypothetical protein
VLQAYDRRFRATQTIEHQYGEVLRLSRDGVENVSAPTIKARPMLDDDVQSDAPKPTQLALAQPAKDTSEMDQLIRDGVFEPTSVDFVDASGRRTTLIAAADPLLEKPGAPEVLPPEDDGLELPPDPPAAPPQNKPIEAHRKFEDLMRRQASGNRLLKPGQTLGSDGYPKPADREDRTGAGGPPPGSRAIKMV